MTSNQKRAAATRILAEALAGLVDIEAHDTHDIDLDSEITFAIWDIEQRLEAMGYIKPKGMQP